VSHEREARIEDAYATKKSAVRESDAIMSALERKRVRVVEDIEAIEAQLRAMPTWCDSGHEYASLANTRDRLWQFIYVLDGMIRAQLAIQDKARRAYCRVLESK
jgi:hypothetical protein